MHSRNISIVIEWIIHNISTVFITHASWKKMPVQNRLYLMHAFSEGTCNYASQQRDRWSCMWSRSHQHTHMYTTQTHCRPKMYTVYRRAGHQIVHHQTGLVTHLALVRTNGGLSPAGHTSAQKDGDETTLLPKLKAILGLRWECAWSIRSSHVNVPSFFSDFSVLLQAIYF